MYHMGLVEPNSCCKTQRKLYFLIEQRKIPSEILYWHVSQLGIIIAPMITYGLEVKRRDFQTTTGFFPTTITNLPFGIYPSIAGLWRVLRFGAF